MPGTSSEQDMETSAVDIVAVCPPEETLRVGAQTHVKCVVPGCERVFAQMSARRFHMVKVHKIIESDQDAALQHHGAGGRQAAGDVRYYCPVPKCKYTPRLGRFFTSMKNLNQHYRHVHAEKKYKCSRCGHGFGELRGQVRHEKTCGLKFVCLQCSNIYNTKDALQTHCTRTGHRSGFSTINTIVFRDAVDGDDYVTAAVQETPLHPAETKTAPMSISSISTEGSPITTQYQQIPAASQPPLTDDSAQTTPQTSSASLVSKVVELPQEQLVPGQSLVTASRVVEVPQEHSATTEPGLSRPQHMGELSELPQSQQQQQSEQVLQQSGKSQLNFDILTQPIPASSQQQEIPQRKSQNVAEISHHQQLTRQASSQPQQGAAILNDLAPTSSAQQEMQETSPQEVAPAQTGQPQQTTAILKHPLLSTSSGQQDIPRCQQSVQVQQTITTLNQTSLPALSVEQEIPVANYFKPEALQSSTLRTALPSAPAYILPRPDALYMPVQLQINRENMIYGGQSGPVILIVNKAPPAEPPKRLKPLAPKATREIGSQSRLRVIHETDRSEVVVGIAREMEVQTEESQRYQDVVATNSLSIQTMPCPMFVDMTSSVLTQKVAETQTAYHPQFVVETQSKSSQVSPTAKLRQTQDSSTGTMSESPAPRGSKQKRKKQTETGSQTGRLKPSTVSAVTTPKKQRRRKKIDGTSTKAAQKQNHGQSPLSIVEVMGSHEVYRSASGTLSTQSEGMLAGHRVSAAVGIAPHLPQFESVGVGTMSSPLSLSDVHISGQPVMVSVSTDMSRANTSVGTMPSPPLPESNSYSNHFTPVSMSTIGTDPLPGFSGSSKDVNLSSVFSQETQTSFWAEFQASFAESNATQTMESYLADTGINGDPLTMPSLMESGVQTCHAQNSQTQTWPITDTVSVGVGTSLLNQPHSPTLFEGMENDGLSRSIGIDTQLFDDLFPEVSSRSVAISTPLLDSMDSSLQPLGMENTLFRPIGQSRSVGVSPLGQHDLTDLDSLSRPNEGQTAASCQTTLSEGQYECIATASVQTDTDFELPVFLTAASQTSTYDPSLTHMETQTVDMFSQLLSNMETQTSTDILAQLNFADIETQTTMSPAAPPTQAQASVETQTAPALAAVREAGSAAGSRMSVYIDTETQTRLPNLHLTENSLTDSHTQTTVQQFASLVDELEKG